MKMFKSLRAARLHSAPDQPILRIKKHYIVGDLHALDSVEMIAPDGNICANVTLGHLARLGNANHAKEADRVAGHYTFEYYEAPNNTKTKLVKKGG